MEKQEPYYISTKDLEEADILLSGVPDIEVHPPTKIIAGHKDKLYEKDSPAWVKLSTTFRDKWLGILQGSKLAVFLAIALHIDENGQSFPGIELISKETGYSERQIIRAIQQLEAQGLLEVTRIYLGNKVSRNFYNVKAFVSYGYNNPKEQSDKMSLASYQSDICDNQSDTHVTLSRTILSRTIKNAQEKTLSPAKKNGGGMRNKEEMLKSTEVSLMKGLTSQYIAYANMPEEILPVVERMDKVWKFKIPSKSAKKSDLSYFITSCRDLLEACGEYGVGLLDEMRSVWEEGMRTHGGTVPFNVNEPQSLVKTMQGFSASKRRGEKYTFRYPSYAQEKHIHSSMLDI